MIQKFFTGLFVAGVIAAVVLAIWAYLFAIYIFQSPALDPNQMGDLLRASQNGEFWLILFPLVGFTLIILALSRAGEGIDNPKKLIQALDLRGWKIIFAVLVIVPLLAVKLARIIWQTSLLKNSRRLAKEVMANFA